MIQYVAASRLIISASGILDRPVKPGYDFSFLAPCPSSGLIVHGEKDAVVPPKDVNTLVEKLKTQKGIVIDQQIIPGANHFFDGKLQPLMESVTGYLDMRLANVR